MKSLVEAADRVGWSRAHSSLAVTASRSALPGSRGKPAVHAVRIVRLGTTRVTDGSAKSRQEVIGFPKHAVLACPTRCLETDLGRLRGQVDKAQGDSKMSRQREMQGWPGTRFPRATHHCYKFAGNCTRRCSSDQLLLLARLIYSATRRSCLPSLRPSNSRRSVAGAFSRPCCTSTLFLIFPACTQPARALIASAARDI